MGEAIQEKGQEILGCHRIGEFSGKISGEPDADGLGVFSRSAHRPFGHFL
jgi:hypothetical protein